MLESWGLPAEMRLSCWNIGLPPPTRPILSSQRKTALRVGGIPTPLKNIDQVGLSFPIYRKNMFQTTNQFISETFRNLPKRRLDVRHRPKRLALDEAFWHSHWIPSGSYGRLKSKYGAFHPVMGVPPNHPVVMNDHDLVLKHIETLKPVVTLGSPICLFNPFHTLPRAFPSIKPCPPRNMPIQTIANSCCDDQPAATYGGQRGCAGIEDHPTLDGWMARVNPNIPSLYGINHGWSHESTWLTVWSPSSHLIHSWKLFHSSTGSFIRSFNHACVSLMDLTRTTPSMHCACLRLSNRPLYSHCM